MPTLTWISHSPEQTQEIATRLGRVLHGGEIFAIHGDLGAGKTCFIQGLASGLEVPEHVYVRSPTFTLIDEYPGRLPLFHLDLYRLADLDELETIGWRDCLDGQSVVAVEWADRLTGFLPENYLQLTFTIVSEHTRKITLEPLGQLPTWWTTFAHHA